MHPPLTLHRHPMCAEIVQTERRKKETICWLRSLPFLRKCCDVLKSLKQDLACADVERDALGRRARIKSIQLTPSEIIEQFQKCHLDHPIGKFFGECTDLKIKLDRCFRQEKAVKRKANFEESKKLKERLRAYRKENAESKQDEKNFMQA